MDRERITPRTPEDPRITVPDGEDPTRITAQPALRTARRRRWLVPGAAFAAVTIVVLAFLVPLQQGIAVFGIAAVAGFYLAMVGVAVFAPDSLHRNRALAILMWLMALAGALSVLGVLGAEAAGLVVELPEPPTGG